MMSGVLQDRNLADHVMRVHAEGVVPNTSGVHNLLTPDQIRSYIGYVKTLDPYIPESLTGKSLQLQHARRIGMSNSVTSNIEIGTSDLQTCHADAPHGCCLTVCQRSSLCCLAVMYDSAAERTLTSFCHGVAGFIASNYAAKRAMDKTAEHSYTTARTLLSILRLAQALARLAFRDVVEQVSTADPHDTLIAHRHN